MKKVATLISRIFDPFLVMLVVAIFAVRRSTLGDIAQARFFLSTVFMMIGIPAGLLVVFIKKKWITNWDMSIRSERPRALLVLFIIELISVWVLQRFADQSLVAFLHILIIWIIGFILITLFWKISGHSGVNALATGYLVSRLGLSWWPLLLIVPLVAWSRVIRKDHTVAQVVAGAIYSWALIALFYMR